MGKYKKLLNNITIFLYFFKRKLFSYFGKWKAPKNSRKFHFPNFFFRKYKKATFPEAFFFLETIKSFFRVGAFKQKYKKFFRETFWRLGPKSVLGSPLIYYVNLIREKDDTYTFMIVNTDKSGAHWWSISWTCIQRRKSFCLRVLVWRDKKAWSHET